MEAPSSKTKEKEVPEKRKKTIKSKSQELPLQPTARKYATDVEKRDTSPLTVQQRGIKSRSTATPLGDEDDLEAGISQRRGVDRRSWKAACQARRA